MRKSVPALFLVLVITLTACGQAGAHTNKNGAGLPKEYNALIKTYEEAMSEGWGAEMLMEHDLNHMIADCYGNDVFSQVGYWTGDLDGDGRLECIVGAAKDVENRFFEKMIFDCYSLDSDGLCVKVLSSGERNRYYYAGENRFVNLGSNSAEDDFEMVLTFKNGGLQEQESQAVPSEFVQLNFKKFMKRTNEVNTDADEVSGIKLHILDEIDKTVEIGTDDAYTTAVQAAVKMLDWASFTGLDHEEIKEAAVSWFLGKGNAERVCFAAKMEQVEQVYQLLLTDEAVDIYISAGCEPEKYPWGMDAVEIVEILMEVVGMR